MRILSFFALGAVAAVAEDNVLDDIIRNLNANSTNSSAASAATSAPDANATSAPMAGNATSAPETSAPATSAPTDANATSAPATSAPATSAPASASGSASAPTATSAPAQASGSASAPAATSAPTQGAATSGPAEATSGPASNSSSGNGTTAAPGVSSVTLSMIVQATVTDVDAAKIATEMAKTASAAVVAEALGGTSVVMEPLITGCKTKCQCTKTKADSDVNANCQVCYRDAPTRRRASAAVRQLNGASPKEFAVVVNILELSETAATSMKTKLTAAASGGALSNDAITNLAKAAATTAGVTNLTFTVVQGAQSDTIIVTTTTSNAFAVVSTGFGLLIAALLF